MAGPVSSLLSRENSSAVPARDEVNPVKTVPDEAGTWHSSFHRSVSSSLDPQSAGLQDSDRSRSTGRSNGSGGGGIGGLTVDHRCGPRCLLHLYMQCTAFLSALTPQSLCSSDDSATAPLRTLLLEELRKSNCLSLFSLAASLTLTSEFSLRLRHTSLLQCCSMVV